MAEVINLNRVRKARKKAEEARVAEENRSRFGRGKVEKALREKEVSRLEKDLDGKKIDE
ncbi:DUF4169 family protein [Telmatospirillum siberiense]|uniref:DUF4169 domain-containing protein n=1 Tax=Telmatospirillum siberiense TaxID=382514 RepID=A0A2N3PP77_9PROT|nr:DUF4169 family protein [Telmatospirillum siberiense]PKU22219.1 DUF4169 domain-containing protein [Telmatospirillum siberiense]